MQTILWDLYRIFFCVADCGSLTLAAKALRMSPPTVSRRVSQLERELDVRLFDRSTDGYQLTKAGNELLPLAERVSNAVSDIERRIATLGDNSDNVVRVSCGNWAAMAILGGLAKFHLSHPEIEVEILMTTDVLSLASHATDIAVRNVRPKQGRLKLRKIAESAHAIYGSKEFVDLHKVDIGVNNLTNLTWIGSVGSIDQTPSGEWLAENIGKRPEIRCSNTRNILDGANAGIGLAILPVFVGDASETLVKLSEDLVLSSKDLWLVVHEDLADIRAVKAVSGWLAELFGSISVQEAS